MHMCTHTHTHTHTHLLRIDFGDERMIEDFTRSDPLICIECHHGLQELDALPLLNSHSPVVFPPTHLVKETSVRFTTSQVILMIRKRQSIIVTLKVNSHLPLSSYPDMWTAATLFVVDVYNIPQDSERRIKVFVLMFNC